jgi:hypothetical protein
VSVTADLDSLRAMIGSGSTKDDGALSQCLTAAGAWVYDRVYSTHHGRSEVQQAILMVASRLYKRRQSPEGVAGWDEMGSVRIIMRDPDVERLLEQHIDAAKVWGIA